MPVYPPIMKNSLPAMKRRWIITPDIFRQRTNGSLWRYIPTKAFLQRIPKSATALTAWWPTLWPEKLTLSLQNQSAGLPAIRWIL